MSQNGSKTCLSYHMKYAYPVHFVAKCYRCKIFLGCYGSELILKVCLLRGHSAGPYGRGIGTGRLRKTFMLQARFDPVILTFERLSDRRTLVTPHRHRRWPAEQFNLCDAVTPHFPCMYVARRKCVQMTVSALSSVTLILYVTRELGSGDPWVDNCPFELNIFKL